MLSLSWVLVTMLIDALCGLGSVYICENQALGELKCVFVVGVV